MAGKTARPEADRSAGRLRSVGWRRIVMTVVILGVLAFYLGVMGFWRNQLLIVTSWFGVGLGLEKEFLLLPHRLHDVTFALVFWPFLLGLIAQLHAPSRKIAAQLMALVTFVGLAIGMGVTGFTDPVMIIAVLGGPTLLATLVHPAGRELLTSIEWSRVNRVALALVIVAAVPLLAYAAVQVGLQTGAAHPAHHEGAGGFSGEEIHDQHIEFGHFMVMVAFPITLIGVGLLASLQQRGWWIPAWVAGLMAIVFGVAALAAPSAASNPGLGWALAAVAWGVVFIGAMEYTQNAEASSPFNRGPTPVTK